MNNALAQIKESTKIALGVKNRLTQHEWNDIRGARLSN